MAQAELPISSADFKAVLSARPSMVQRLCTIYIQDFLCLGYPLPPACEHGRELAWSRAEALT